MPAVGQLKRLNDLLQTTVITYLITESVGTPSRLVKNIPKNKKSNPSNLNNNVIINYKNLNISYYIYK